MFLSPQNLFHAWRDVLQNKTNSVFTQQKTPREIAFVCLSVICNRKRHSFLKPTVHSLELLSTDPTRVGRRKKNQNSRFKRRERERERLFVNAAQWLRGGNITYYILPQIQKIRHCFTAERTRADQKYSFWQRRHTREKGDARVLEACARRKGKSQLEWSSTNVGRESQHLKLWHYLCPGTDWPLFPLDSASIWEVYPRDDRRLPPGAVH